MAAAPIRRIKQERKRINQIFLVRHLALCRPGRFFRGGRRPAALPPQSRLRNAAALWQLRLPLPFRQLQRKNLRPQPMDAAVRVSIINRRFPVRRSRRLPVLIRFPCQKPRRPVQPGYPQLMHAAVKQPDLVQLIDQLLNHDRLLRPAPLPGRPLIRRHLLKRLLLILRPQRRFP